MSIVEQEPDPLAAAADEFARRYLDRRFLWILAEAGARDGPGSWPGTALWARLPKKERITTLYRWMIALERGTLPSGPGPEADTTAAIRANAQALEATRAALRERAVGRPLTQEQRQLLAQERAKVEAQIAQGNVLLALAWELGHAAALARPAEVADAATVPALSQNGQRPSPPPVRASGFIRRDPKPWLRRLMPSPSTGHRK